MSRFVLLDSGPVGLITSPRASGEAAKCRDWPRNLAIAAVIGLPEVVDYEIRRELLRTGREQGIGRLDALKADVIYLPITTEVMLLAAELWASARRQGRPTTDPHALDADVIIAAQARLTEQDGNQVVVATGNVGHLGLFVTAIEWENVSVMATPWEHA